MEQPSKPRVETLRPDAGLAGFVTAVALLATLALIVLSSFG